MSIIPKVLPFYFASQKLPGNGGFPESLPFNLIFDENLNMYRQKPDKELKDILHKVYELGSLVDGSISNESGSVYVKQAIDYILKMNRNLAGKRVLEIGCGNGIILKNLKETKAILVGLEPGNHSLIEGLDEEIIIRDFFPSVSISGKFDLILHFFVLEHMEHPEEFIVDQKKLLRDDGKIIIGVPNCEPFFEGGDLSIYIHEHYNYFTRENIIRLIEKIGLFVEDISVLDGMLICTLTQNPLNFLKHKTNFIFDKNKFEDRILQLNNRVLNLFDNYEESKVAVYVPGRALNTLFLAKKPNCRLVDDNSEIRGKYLPYLNRPVEGFDQILKDPPDCILIYSRTFGKMIKEKCKKSEELKHTEIISISDL